MSNKILSLLGLATRSRNLVSGELPVAEAVRKGQAQLVILASDASDNTKKKFGNMCDHYHVPIYYHFDKDTLGHAIGKEFRASIAVLDSGFANTIQQQLDRKE